MEDTKALGNEAASPRLWPPHSSHVDPLGQVTVCIFCISIQSGMDLFEAAGGMLST